MLRLGVFAKTFVRPTVEQVFDAVTDHGLSWVQFNFACAGLPPLPEFIDPALARRVRQAADIRCIRIAAVSGTFNLIHPNPAQRADALRRLRTLAAACDTLNTQVITLCTGTRDPLDMWRGHPDNASGQAWTDLTRSLETALALAEEFGLTLGIEPESANVIDSAARARRLLDDMGSPRLKIVLDPANLLPAGTREETGAALDAAFDLLGADLVLAHAKECGGPGSGRHGRLGAGLLDWDRYLRRLKEARFSGALVLHGMEATEVEGSVAFLRDKWAALGNS